MKHIIARAGIFAVLAFVLAFLSMPASADCFQDGFNAGQSAGIQQCKDNPGDYGLVKSGAITQAGIDDGKKQCKDDPVKCGLFSNPNTATKTAIEKYCSTDDDFCGITETQAGNLAQRINDNCDLDNNCGITIVTPEGKTAGKNECRENPVECRLFPNPNTATKTAIKKYCDTGNEFCGLVEKQTLTGNLAKWVNDNCDLDNNCGITIVTPEGKTAGKNECRENPATEGCEGLVKSGAITQAGIVEGKKQCKDDPVECRLFPNLNTATKTAIKKYCDTGNEFCGLVEKQTLTGNLAKWVNTNCDPGDKCKITIITSEGKTAGKNECQNDSVTCGVFSNPNLVTVDAIKNYCSTDEDFCGITGTQKDKLAKWVNTNCDSDNNCGITIITSEGKVKGKQECQNDPSACFSDSPSQFTSYIPQESCNKKTQNCVSMKDDKLYLPVIGMEVAGGKTIPVVKNVEMDWLRKQRNAGTNQISIPLVFVYNYKAEDYVKEAETVTLKVNTPEQAGQVISYPVGINCGNDCTEVYEIGNFVNLFAVPQNSNTVFTGWNGDVVGCGGKANHIVVWMDVDGKCEATFAAIDSGVSPSPTTHKLTVNIKETGSGKVTSEPLGIDCDEDDCTAKYDSGIEVTLTATPTTDFKFMGWAGSSGCGDKVTMNTDLDCTAIFSPAH
ncbi:MAG: hypothetical protein DRR19_19640 [Candidatus Parabeggiatoa sp. nov. 1]|nr:MAG: hypothetical protein DRR19_19640 [Gammaproteobacteria bacterium]